MANKRIKDLTTTITAFRSGDVIPVDGPSGTAKMSKDDLLKETAENTLATDDFQNVKSFTELGEFERADYLLYINRSLDSGTGDIGLTDRLDRVCTKIPYQVTNMVPFKLVADEGYSFVLYAYASVEPLSFIGKTDWIKEIDSDKIKADFTGVVLFRIVCKADDGSNIPASTFNYVHYTEKWFEQLGSQSVAYGKLFASNGCGWANVSLNSVTGLEFGENSKRLSSPLMSTSVFSAISPADGYEYIAYIFDNRKNMLNKTSWLTTRQNVNQLKISHPNARYIRLTVKKVVEGVDVDIDPITDGKNIHITNRIVSDTSLSFERGSLSLLSGKFLKSSTTDDDDNSAGFYGHWRTGKYIRTSSSRALFVFNDSLVTNPKLFEYDEKFNLVGVTSVTALTFITLQNNTMYIKFMGDATNNPVVDAVLEDASVKLVCNTDEEYTEHSYIYEVAGNCGMNVYDDDPAITQYDNNQYYYNSLTFKLPPKYSSTGKPVPVIFFCHGSGAMNSRISTSMGASYQPYLEYLNAEGYAVLDCFSTSSKFPNPGQALHNSNLDDMACIASAIKWFTDNYNVEKDVYFMCKSRGGNAALAACYSSAYKVKACGLLAPSLSIFSRNCIFAYESQCRMNFATDMGFENVGALDVTCLNYPDLEHPTADAKTYVRGNWKKLIGLCSTFSGFPGSTTEDMVDALVDYDYADPIFDTTPKDLNVPVKIWIAIDDDQVSYPEALKWQKQVQLGHGIAVIRTMPSNTGKHHAVDTDADALKVSSIVTELGITKTNVPLAYVEVVRWFRQFE